MTTATHDLGSVRLRAHVPVKVYEGIGHAWFPVVHRFPSGELVAHWSMMPDIHCFAYVAGLSHSTDDGRTWSPAYPIGQFSNMAYPVAGGSALRRMPYYVYPRSPGERTEPAELTTELYTLYPLGERTHASGRGHLSDHATSKGAGASLGRYEVEPFAVRVLGLPTPAQVLATGAAVLNFTGAVVERGGAWLATMYGGFGSNPAFRFDLIVVESRDEGRTWRYLATIDRYADMSEAERRVQGVEGSVPWESALEGPCEACLCELEGGELLCVYRVGSGLQWPYRGSRSTDGGRTWGPRFILGEGLRSVEPSLKRLDNGVLALSGGRPGLFLWLAADGRGERWETFDIAAHHNRAAPDPRDHFNLEGPQTTSYTELVALGPDRLLMIYDRTPLGWNQVPLDSPERNMIFVVEVEIG